MSDPEKVGRAMREFGRVAQEAGRRFSDAIARFPRVEVEEDQHTSSCEELRRKGIVRTCTCPKGF